jgi:His/Glu/Gln/Arg/opine family amino acid ABC transporter permease subunit
MSFQVVIDNLPFLLAGLRVTGELAFLTIIGGTILGLVIGVIRYMRWPVLDQLAALYIEFIRGTPLLVVLFICYFALPALFGYHTSAYRAAILGFILFIAAYLAEDFRSGLRAVRPQTVQAAAATGLPRWKILRLIVIPLAVRQVIPTLFNQYVRLFKFTSVSSVLGVHELTGSALLVNGREFQPVSILGSIALTYLVCCYLISLIGRLLYQKMIVRS